MYFGFDGNTEGFEKILSRIADNSDGGKLDHKKVRAYARCLLCILPEITIHFDVKPEVQILLASLAASGLPHYDRAFLASQILKLVEDSTILKADLDGDSIF